MLELGSILALGCAAMAFVLFVVGVIRDPRSFSNAVLLGLALALAAFSAAQYLAHDPDQRARSLLIGLLILIGLGPFLVAGFLVINGVTVIRREGLRPVNLLSLLAGLALFAVLGATVMAQRVDSIQFTLATAIADLLFGYVSFLLLSYVLYAVCYGRLSTLLASAEFVIVLGAGLKRDGRPTPLLARRLNRGYKVYLALTRLGDKPRLIVSGGKGSDERISEADSMFSYLTGLGVPPDQIMREDRSRTTEENLRFSQELMERVRPGARCVIVTSNFHVFRTAMLAQHLGLRGQVTGAPVAGYYWPSAMLREFAAVFLRYRLVNFAVCLLIIVATVAYASLQRFH